MTKQTLTQNEMSNILHNLPKDITGIIHEYTGSPLYLMY